LASESNTHHAHVELLREVDVGGIAPAACDQRQILVPV
jgi:hypothetical protein